ncbi:MAG: magnesium-protoporphyrin IX monomethyl ester cyclase, partial [Symploca sp. SIO1C4]|nr:magnesium-protoporphyrin IX monomethyl ester cyclase [Symploca sp. SIO1C4]
LLSVFVTHSLTVHERAGFYHSIGLEPTEYDMEIIRQTNKTSARAFPAILDVEHPEFFPRLYHCSDCNLKLAEINKSNSPKFIKFFQKLPMQWSIFWNLLRLYLIKPIDSESSRGVVK